MIERDFVFGCQEIGDVDDLALLLQQGRARNAALETENAKLRLALQDARRALELAPDLDLPGSVWLKVWGRQTVIQLCTKTIPRQGLMLIGTAVIAVLLAHWVR